MMSAALQLYGLTDEHRRRVLALLDYEGDEDPDEELLFEIDEQRGCWYAERGDGSSWDVIHWALTGTRSSTVPRKAHVFGIDPANELPFKGFFGNTVWMLTPSETQRLARTLGVVDETAMRERLRRLPLDVYRAEGHHARVGDPQWNELQDTLADARDLVTYVERCADDELGLLLFIS